MYLYCFFFVMIIAPLATWFLKINPYYLEDASPHISFYGRKSIVLVTTTTLKCCNSRQITPLIISQNHNLLVSPYPQSKALCAAVATTLMFLSVTLQQKSRPFGQSFFFLLRHFFCLPYFLHAIPAVHASKGLAYSVDGCCNLCFCQLQILSSNITLNISSKTVFCYFFRLIALFSFFALL